jgi:hypothetical protein
MVNNFFTSRSGAAVGGRIRRYVAVTLAVTLAVILSAMPGGPVAGAGRPGGARDFLARNISSLNSHFK